MQSPGDNNNPLPWAGNDTLGDLSNISISAGPFTTTSFFNNFDSFLVGLNIETWYNSSTECFEPIFFLIDDTYFLRANFTSENRTILGQVLNVTKVIATNFADILPNCIMFEQSIRSEALLSLEAFDYSVGNILWSFLFNQMSNAPTFPIILNTLEFYKKQGNMPRYWLGIGYMANLILDFEPLSIDATLTPTLQQRRTTLKSDQVSEWVNQSMYDV